MTDLEGSSDRPRLLVLASTYPRWVGDPEPGFVHELSRRLTDKFEVTVVCPAAPGALKAEVLDGVRVVRFRYAPRALQRLVNDGGIVTNLKRSLWKWLLLPPFLVSLALTVSRVSKQSRPDVVHAHWLVPQGFVAALVLARRPTKLVITSHGSDLFALRGPVFAWFKRYAVRRAQRITVVSSPMVEMVVKLGAIIDDVSIEPMGVDLRGRFTRDDQVTRSRRQILFVGRMVEKKGLKYLIEAMPRVLESYPDAELLVAGFGPEEGERKRQAEALGVGESVKFLGAVPQSRLAELYRRASIFVAPFVEASNGDREGLGLVLVEAAGCGCPVAVSDTATSREVFNGCEVEYFQAGNAAAIARTISKVFDAPRQASVKALMRLDWDEVADRYRTILAP